MYIRIHDTVYTLEHPCYATLSLSQFLQLPICLLELVVKKMYLTWEAVLPLQNVKVVKDLMHMYIATWLFIHLEMFNRYLKVFYGEKNKKPIKPPKKQGFLCLFFFFFFWGVGFFGWVFCCQLWFKQISS